MARHRRAERARCGGRSWAPCLPDGWSAGSVAPACSVDHGDRWYPTSLVPVRLRGREAGPVQVRAEHLDTSLGIGEREPRLSWRLPAESGEQLAYEVRGRRGLPCASRGMSTCWCRGPARPWRRASGARYASASRPTHGWASGPSRWRSRPGCSSRPTGGRLGLHRPTTAGPPGHRPAYRLRGEVVGRPASRPGPPVRDRARDLRAVARRTARRRPTS